MISIIICSINETFLGKVKESIAATIGIDHEILVWNNRQENLGICRVYNRLAEEAKFEFLCFLHEDIIFKTKNWGQLIVSMFLRQQDVGIIGLAGCKYKSLSYSGWYSGKKELDCMNIVHRSPDGDEYLYNKPSLNSDFEDVVCIDGVFIATRKEVWRTIKFDEKFLSGFHFYDIDFSLRVFRGNRVVVTYNIGVIHITKGGNFGKDWLMDAINFHKRYSSSLPVSINKKLLDKRIEKGIIIIWLDILKNYEINFAGKWKWIVDQKLYCHPGYYYSIMKFAFYHPFGLKRLHKWKK